jgi:predicted MFS family arabinose efflux permease
VQTESRIKAVLENMKETISVPEPSSLGLLISSLGLLIGGLGLLIWTHSTRRRNLPIKPRRAFTDFRG